ncbi:MAG: DUF1501 domain-containing protein [Saprospiraceae bacterium]|nr:DUF1501 domain-containing protein [Saprospiraceae bacterium]
MKDHKINPNLIDRQFGCTHDEEHQIWNRRQFMMTSGMAGLGSVLLGGLTVSPLLGNSSMMLPAEGDNILVLIKMFGGNDGLNMVVPATSASGVDEYTRIRPTIGLKKGTDYSDNHILSGYGNSDFALPQTMESLMPLWNEGKMNIIHNVGYPKQDYSHFSSINFWSTAADNDQDKRVQSGIIGRFLDQDFPSFSESPPTVPPALRIGYSTDKIFSAPGNQQMELVFNDPNEFLRLAQYGKLYETDGFGDCPQGQERSFLRALTNNTLRYSNSVVTAYGKASNKVAFPTGTQSRLAEQLAIISRLIKGRLGTKMFLVNIDGFDTHSNQKDYHLRILGDMAKSVKAFYDDLKADSMQSNVTVMTYSEFGRTIKENGSVGTDHGNLSPLMMFGDGVNPGFHGTPINLYDPILKTSTIVYYETQASTDYRSIFQSVLKDWLCLNGELTEYTMGKSYPSLNLFKNPCSGALTSNNNAVLVGHNPNPENPRIVDMKFSNLQSGEVEIKIKSVSGRTLVNLYNKYTLKGSYTVPLDPSKWKLNPGEYIYELNSAGKRYMRRFLIQ